MLLLSAAFAYETDQISDRAQPLDDIAAYANAAVERMLGRAAEETNRITGCSGSQKHMKKVLSREIYRVTSHDVYVKNRGELGGFGHGAYAAWLESAELPRRTYADGEGLYGDVDVADGFVLGAAGVCSTVNIAGVLMGTDKPNHFFAQGYEYLRASDYGRHDAPAVRRGTATELGAYGLLTSSTFSWADLYANWQGYTFYKALLEKGSVLQRDEEGCVALVDGWDWSKWLDDGADELVNPPVYTPRVGLLVRARLEREPATICEGYEGWGPAAALRRQQIIARELTHASAKAPARVDEWGLEGICGAGGN
jgi:hypothetical protein